MRTIYKFAVVPSLPQPLSRLLELAKNIWWSWNFDAIELFLRIDHDLWEKTSHNPLKLLGTISQDRLEQLALDKAYLHSLERVMSRFDTAMSSGRDFKVDKPLKDFLVAYFSLEFGLHESLPIYSGGLGILAGDHLKSASDIGIPFVGVGLLYREGYFRQYLNLDGWQQETYPDNDPYNLPIHEILDENSKPVVIEVDFPERTVFARIWKVYVGRTILLLLDTNIEANSIEDREITAQLYGGDVEMRLKQELILGYGGICALEKIGYNPTVYHMNEGHSAFLGLKRIKDLMNKHGLSFAQSLEACSSCNVFTTHTPVPAGIDKFNPALMDKYFWRYREEVGISREEFLGLGRENPQDSEESFSLAILAIRLSDRYNGVSKLHGEVSRKMWRNLWLEVPEGEIPIDHVTNGIHNRTWVSHELGSLFDRYLGPRWRETSEDPSLWERIDQVPDAELWRTHERRRERLVAFTRKRARLQAIRRGANKAEISLSEELLDPEILTIGFARRFATYKRATLIFSDMDRIIKLLLDSERPIQIIFAGKAHPKDNLGKELIRQIIHRIRKHDIRHRVVFIEDYDINVARYMLQGVDVWLNTPRRPHEASGTSGMKASANGAMNLSVLDGWWCEGYDIDTGWAIGNGEEYTDLTYQDEVESRALYNLLEKEIIPTFYSRGRDSVPREWLSMMKATFKKLSPIFNTNRMVNDYARKFYLPATRRWNDLKKDQFSGAKELTSWKEKVRHSWHEVKILSANSNNGIDEIKVGEMFQVIGEIHLGSLSHEDVNVQVLYGAVNPEGNLIKPQIFNLKMDSSLDNGKWKYIGSITCINSGLHGFSIRVIPYNEALTYIHETGLVRWG
jgi:glycogen phosphorylase